VARREFEQLLGDLLARVESEEGVAFGDRRLLLAALTGMVEHTAQWYQPRGRLSPHDVADGYLMLVRCLASHRHLVAADERRSPD
jgi:hypothetical protein